jgi:hypothetical protein
VNGVACSDFRRVLVGDAVATSRSGLPDGLFSNQKSKFGKILEGLAMEDVGILYGHLVHFTVFCYIVLALGIVCGNLVYFSRFGILYQEKSGNPAHATYQQQQRQFQPETLRFQPVLGLSVPLSGPPSVFVPSPIHV